MITEYDYGPIGRVSLRLYGEARDLYGGYDDLPPNVQEALQLLCHAVIQLSDDIKRAEAGVFWIGKLMIMSIGDRYCLSNFNTGMAIMNLREEQKGRFSTDFFSVKQMALADPILTIAENHALANGRHEG
ncbi:MAG: hypothetical protein IJH45_01495 [Firmicutes bacterium]|nr:hypothetical protein [Bacillota bacterium]